MTPTVVVVDDSVTVRMELADAFRASGFRPLPCSSAPEARGVLSRVAFSACIVGLPLREGGGIDLLREVRSSSSNASAIVVLLSADAEDRALGLHGGADECLDKPCDAGFLANRIQELLYSRQRLGPRALPAPEDENKRLRRELERKSAELEAFRYSVSHDLRAPLRSIDGFTRALQDQWADTLEPRAKDYLARVRAATLHMNRLFDDLLELSRVGRAELNRVETNLSEIARGVATELRKQDPERQIEIEVQDGLVANADRRLMRTLFDHLIGNGWKFTMKTAQPRIEVGRSAGEDGDAYFVRDNGAGFDMEYSEKLFKPFQRLHRTADFPGTGIGLAMVHRIIDLHGGRVSAEAIVGRGATFTFTIPASAMSSPPPSQPGARA
jgi:signal transduction histidine kinase